MNNAWWRRPELAPEQLDMRAFDADWRRLGRDVRRFVRLTAARGGRASDAGMRLLVARYAWRELARAVWSDVAAWAMVAVLVVLALTSDRDLPIGAFVVVAVANIREGLRRRRLVMSLLHNTPATSAPTDAPPARSSMPAM